MAETKDKNTVLPESLAAEACADLLNFMEISSRESQDASETAQNLLVSLSLKNVESDRRAN